MFCPSCNHQLLPISLRGKTGTQVLDYCKICGGTWTDQGEVNFLGLHDLDPLFALLGKIASDTSGQTLHCPKDRSILEIFRSESIPDDLTIFRCGDCDGTFFPSGTLTDFKKAQEAKVNYFKTWHIPLSSVYAVLLPLLLVLLIGGGLWATLISVEKPTDVSTKAEDVFSVPVVYQTKSDQWVIFFTTKDPAVTKIRYWTTPMVIKEVWVSRDPQLNHTVTLQNILPNQSYSYQMVKPNVSESTVYTFSTTKKSAP